MQIFMCPVCKNKLNGFNPGVCRCGFRVPVIDGVYQFTNDKPISTDDDNLKWLGYEQVGENYEPAYALSQDIDGFGMFGSCARKVAEIIDKDSVALDLGAGLGQASIPLALSGIRTIAIDISQKMMAIAVRRAKENNVSADKLICARMNAYCLELADNSIDAVIENDMLHQVDRPDLVMEEIKRVLKKDGCLVKYGSKGFEHTDEEKAENARYNEALKDIQSFYRNRISGHEVLPFSSWDKASDCIKNEFDEPVTVESEERISVVWNLKMGLHKLRTRASGSAQLIPDQVHNEAWRKTEEYAINKYGQNYNDISRHFNMIGYINVYRMRH